MATETVTGQALSACALSVGKVLLTGFQGHDDDSPALVRVLSANEALTLAEDLTRASAVALKTADAGVRHG